MGGRDNAHIHKDVIRTADSTKGFFLDHSQKLDLQQGRQLGNLVQKNGSSLGEFEKSCLV